MSFSFYHLFLDKANLYIYEKICARYFCVYYLSTDNMKAKEELIWQGFEVIL